MTIGRCSLCGGPVYREMDGNEVCGQCDAVSERTLRPVIPMVPRNPGPMRSSRPPSPFPYPTIDPL